MKILPSDQLPSEIKDAPEDSLIDLYKVFLQMENLCLVERGVGLSAVQVGIPWRAFIVRTDDYKKSKATKPTFRYLVNCEYEPAEGSTKLLSVEGCLSLKDARGELRMFRVERNSAIVLRGKELISTPKLELGRVEETVASGSAIIYQHEIDHHRGRLISDSGFGTELEVW